MLQPSVHWEIHPLATGLAVRSEQLYNYGRAEFLAHPNAHLCSLDL
jgi:hypothetical protein